MLSDVTWQTVAIIVVFGIALTMLIGRRHKKTWTTNPFAGWTLPVLRTSTASATTSGTPVVASATAVPRMLTLTRWMLRLLGLVLLVLGAVLFGPSLVDWAKDTEVMAWYQNLKTTDLWMALIILGGIILIAHWLFGRPHTDRLVLTVRAIALIALLILIGPSIARWIGSYSPLCIGSDTACQMQEAERLNRLKQEAWAKQVGIEEARKKAGTLTSSVCPGGRQKLFLRPGQSVDINFNKCAVYSVTALGKVTYYDWLGRKSDPIGPEGGKVDLAIYGVTAPSNEPAAVEYVLCTGDSTTPVDDECRPLSHKMAVRP